MYLLLALLLLLSSHTLISVDPRKDPSTQLQPFHLFSSTPLLLPLLLPLPSRAHTYAYITALSALIIIC